MTLLVAACEPGSAALAAGLREQLQVELRGAPFVLVDSWAAGAVGIRVGVFAPACHDGEGVRVTIDGPVGDPLRREVTEEGDAVRILALTIVEGVRDVASRPPPVVEPTASRAALDEARREADRQRASLRSESAALRARLDEVARRARAERASRRRQRSLPEWELGAGATAWAYAGGGAALAGPAIGGAVALAGPLHLSADLVAGFGELETTLGGVSLASVRGVLALELRVRRAPFVGAIGLLGASGWSRAEGRADAPGRVDAHTIEAATVSVGLRGGAAFELDPEWALFLRGEAGVAFGGLGIRVDDTRVASTRGVLLGLSLGVRFNGPLRTALASEGPHAGVVRPSPSAHLAAR